MKNLSSTMILLMSAASLLASCTPNISSESIGSENANQATATLPGKIVNMNVVTVNGNGNNVGTIAGGAAGAVAGSAIGGGDRVPLLGAIGGALLGGTAGNYAQGKLSQQQGMQYTVQVGPHHFLTVVQGMQPAYSIGQCVFLIQGAHARINSAAADPSVCDNLS